MGEKAMERVVCISGGTSGIGAALVAAFLEAGDRVYTFARNPRRLAALQEQHAAPVSEGRLIARLGDVSDEVFRRSVVEHIATEHGRLDVLINNAGVILAAGTLEESLAQWRATLEINLVAPFAWVQSCADLLGRGHQPVVVNLSSACGQHAFASCTSTSYSVSKAGLDMLTQRLALALGPRGIRVNAVAPGVVASPMWGSEVELMRTTAQQRHVLGGQEVEPQDIARAVLFLVSPEARMVTGSTLKVDAGYTLG